MSIVGAIGVHRGQLAFEYLDTATGELKRGPVVQPDREQLQDEVLGGQLADLDGQS